MVSFFWVTWRLFRDLYQAVQKDLGFRSLLGLFTLVLIVGTVFYWRWEGWGIIDSLYFCVMTMATIGYGDIVPTTSFSKLFTIVYTLLSVGLFAATVSQFVSIMLVHRKKSTQDKSGSV